MYEKKKERQVRVEVKKRLDDKKRTWQEKYRNSRKKWKYLSGQNCKVISGGKYRKEKITINNEGQVQYNENDQTIPDDFKCTKCEGGGVEDQVEKIKQAQETIDTDSVATERDITETEGKIKHLEKKMTEDLGPRQKILKQSFTKLGI